MKPSLRQFALTMMVLLITIAGFAAEANAYSYAAAGKEPLIVNREPLLSAVAKGDWQAAAKSYDAMKADLAYLDQNEDPGITAAFDAAMAAKSADAVRHALMRAYADEIERRLKGAGDNIKDYQTAKVLVVKAQQFLEAMAGDLDPQMRKAAEDGLKRALDAIGNPGIFGVGRRAPNPDAFAKAHADVKAALADLHAAAK